MLILTQKKKDLPNMLSFKYTAKEKSAWWTAIKLGSQQIFS